MGHFFFSLHTITFSPFIIISNVYENREHSRLRKIVEFLWEELNSYGKSLIVGTVGIYINYFEKKLHFGQKLPYIK